MTQNWTESRFKEWEDSQNSDADPPEKVLQGKIIAWARDHGFPCLSFPQSPKVKQFLPAGWPDIILAIKNGRVLFLELKTKKKGLRKAQKQTRKELLFLGHHYHVCRTWKRFVEIIDMPVKG